MKRLPLFRRPRGAKRILEVGGGHAPYEGVTHAVDKYPDDNAQRASNMRLGEGVEFRQGDLEAIPFESEPKFDFFYASHVLEHVTQPQKAIDEINRVATRGYIETPSPLREQLDCPYPYDKATDFHFLYCWTIASEPNTIHVLTKTQGSVGEFCGCEDGKLAKHIFVLRREKSVDIDPLLPRDAKTTQLFFDGPVRLKSHTSLTEACRSGHCAYQSSREVRRWIGFPNRLFSKRFGQLKEILTEPRTTAG